MRKDFSFATTPNPLWGHLPPVKVFCRRGKGSQEAPSNIYDMHRMNGAVYSHSLHTFEMRPLVSGMAAPCI